MNASPQELLHPGWGGVGLPALGGPGAGAAYFGLRSPEDRLLAEAALQDLLRHPGTTLEYRLRVLAKEGGVRAVRVWGRNLLQDEAIRAW